MISDEVEQKRNPLVVQAAAAPEIVWTLRAMFEDRVTVGASRPDGRVAVELRGWDVPSLAGEVAGLGAQVEVLEPASVRERLAVVAAELAGVYA
jgi:predicted DNA-binding transcriptional regulator YafY